MANIDKLRRETNDIKNDAVANDTNKMEDYILKILTEYYYSYVNNDMDGFQTAADQLEDIITVASGQYNNVDNYINSFCIKPLCQCLDSVLSLMSVMHMTEFGRPVAYTYARICIKIHSINSRSRHILNITLRIKLTHKLLIPIRNMHIGKEP